MSALARQNRWQRHGSSTRGNISPELRSDTSAAAGARKKTEPPPPPQRPQQQEEAITLTDWLRDSRERDGGVTHLQTVPADSAAVSDVSGPSGTPAERVRPVQPLRPRSGPRTPNSPLYLGPASRTVRRRPECSRGCLGYALWTPDPQTADAQRDRGFRKHLLTSR